MSDTFPSDVYRLINPPVRNENAGEFAEVVIQRASRFPRHSFPLSPILYRFLLPRTKAHPKYTAAPHRNRTYRIRQARRRLPCTDLLNLRSRSRSVSPRWSPGLGLPSALGSHRRVATRLLSDT